MGNITCKDKHYPLNGKMASTENIAANKGLYQNTLNKHYFCKHIQRSMFTKRRLFQTDDGSFTFMLEDGQECYHSTRGALQEAWHIYLRAGLCYYWERYPQSKTRPVRIFEMGFGTGLNAWVTQQKSDEQRAEVHYTALEKYPLCSEEVRSLPYSQEASFLHLHEASWECKHSLSPYFSLHKQEGDLLDYNPPPGFDLIYFDAFSPERQADLWTCTIFARMFQALQPGGFLLTYSSKGLVKEALRSAGFSLERLPGASGKRHMIRACKPRIY